MIHEYGITVTLMMMSYFPPMKCIDFSPHHKTLNLLQVSIVVGQASGRRDARGGGGGIRRKKKKKSSILIINITVTEFEFKHLFFPPTKITQKKK